MATGFPPLARFQLHCRTSLNSPGTASGSIKDMEELAVPKSMPSTFAISFSFLVLFLRGCSRTYRFSLWTLLPAPAV